MQEPPPFEGEDGAEAAVAPPRPDFVDAAGEAPRAAPFDRDRACDRALGAFLGGALGDALGLQTEGDDTFAAADRHPAGPDYPYRGAYRGFPPGDWTDATDNAVVVARSLGAYFAGTTEDPAAEFARRLLDWHKRGFPELGDVAGVGAESVVQRALLQPGFAARPAEAAAEVRGPKADNGAMTRAVACAFTTAPADWAILFADATHADPRAAATAAFYAELLHALMRRPDGAPVTPAAAGRPAAVGRLLLAAPAAAGQRAAFMRALTQSHSLAEIDPGGRDNRSYTVKTAACAMWALRQLIRRDAQGRYARDGDASGGLESGPEFFKRVLREIAAVGGDASANGAVVGAVLGAALGTAGLPPDWIAALPNRAWLEAEVVSFLRCACPTWEVM